MAFELFAIAFAFLAGWMARVVYTAGPSEPDPEQERLIRLAALRELAADHPVWGPHDDDPITTVRIVRRQHLWDTEVDG